MKDIVKPQCFRGFSRIYWGFIFEQDTGVEPIHKRSKVAYLLIFLTFGENFGENKKEPPPAEGSASDGSMCRKDVYTYQGISLMA